MVHASVMASGDTSLGAAGPSLGVNRTITLVAVHRVTCVRLGAARDVEDVPSLGASFFVKSVVTRNAIWTACGTADRSLGVSLVAARGTADRSLGVSLVATAVAECLDSGVLSIVMRDFGAS